MEAYICALCERMFCHHSVGCYEYGHNELICEDCHIEREEEREQAVIDHFGGGG